MTGASRHLRLKAYASYAPTQGRGSLHDQMQAYIYALRRYKPVSVASERKQLTRH